MTRQQTHLSKRPFAAILTILVCAGFGSFLILLGFREDARAWQVYLVNVLFCSAIAQGALLFSMIMHVTKARWSGALQNLSEAFAAFFPISFVLFFLLYFGRAHLFPWLGQDLHGKEVWLNVPFLMTRNLVGLMVLYGLGIAYVYHAFRCKTIPLGGAGGLRSLLGRIPVRPVDPSVCRDRMTTLAVLYMIAYALVLSLISVDWVMSMDPHFISTLFGGYFFIKAFYIGMGGLIILASILYLVHGEKTRIDVAHFHDIGKLFFAFCVMWAYFLYAQVLVIWYGNIPEETHYLIERFKYQSWKLAFIIAFTAAFMIPFFTLLNRNVKMKPAVMLILTSLALTGIWFENLVMVGPPLRFDTQSLPLRIFDVLISLGFLSLLSGAVAYLLRLFPELFLNNGEKITR
ncbi:MAG: hypothetical protein RBT16_03885 [Desulfococcus multivorans]|jgi:hypothetical protein|nr:hypothetical protein [Desulfococcus multivorans]